MRSWWDRLLLTQFGEDWGGLRHGRRLPGSDAKARETMRDSDPTVRLTQLGIAPRDAKGLVRTLRQDAARMSNDLLPDVAYSAAPGPLLGGWRVVSEVVTEAVHENMKGSLDLPVTKEQAPQPHQRGRARGHVSVTRRGAGTDQRWSASATVWAKPWGSSCGTL
jgi:hypothetical protein